MISDSMEEAGEGMKNREQEKLAGFIFMCNKFTKADCYRFRVFGLPAGRKEVVEKINPGAYLFLFDTDMKLLYGIYKANSSGKLRIEPLAFGQRFPAQVRFKIYKDCIPLPENIFRHAIQDNYQKNSSKFKPELNIRQVRSLLSLFRTLPGYSTQPVNPVLEKIPSPSTPFYPSEHNQYCQQPKSPLEDAIVSRISGLQVSGQLNYNHVNELKQPTGYSYPVTNMTPKSVAAETASSRASTYQRYAPTSLPPWQGTYASRMGGTYYAPPQSDAQYTTHQNIPNPLPEYHPSQVRSGPISSLPLEGSYVAGMGSSYYVPPQPDAQHTTHQNIPDTYSSAVNMGRSYHQSLSDPHHTHQNNSSWTNMGHANVMLPRALSYSQEAAATTYEPLIQLQPQPPPHGPVP